MYFTVSDKIKLTVSNDKSYISLFGILLIFTALLHHLVFCFINTNIFHISSSALVFTELSLLAITIVFFIKNPQINYLILLLVVLTNAFILAVLQQGFDPKQVRNYLIPVLMLWLGTQYDKRISVDSLVKTMGLVVLAVSLTELIFSDPYQKFFNILNYQIAIGSAEESAKEYANSNFAVNGVRFGGRNFLGFLGDHRVASVFLETVNTSNFSTLIAAWGLSKKTFKEAWLYLFIAITVALLADSRFGVTLICFMIFLRLTLNITLLKITSYFMPLIILMICFYLGSSFTEFNDDFKTRLGSTGYLILHFSPYEFFGASSNHYASFLDQGYARVLHYNGLPLLLFLWVTFCRLKVQENAVIFKCFAAVIIAANLGISGDSIFAFKWAAIMWFLIGTTLTQELK